MDAELRARTKQLIEFGLKISFTPCLPIEDCAKDGGEEFFTELHCVRITNLYGFYRNSIK